MNLLRDWADIALDLGYENEKEMWMSLCARMTPLQLATRFGVSLQVISTSLRQNGIRAKGRKKFPKGRLTPREALALKKEGIRAASVRLNLPYHLLYARVRSALLRGLRKDLE